MGSINDLKLEEDAVVETDYDKIPEESSGFAPPTYPGDYLLRLPQDLSVGWGTSGEKKDQRVYIQFDDDVPLTIVQAPAGTDANGVELSSTVGNVVRCRLSNKERKRFGGEVKVSDMTYLLRVLEPTAKPLKNSEFIAIMGKQGGKQFVAAVEYQGFCNPKRDAWGEFADETTGGTKMQKLGKVNEEGVPTGEVKPGCGETIYQNNWPKTSSGHYAPKATCKCGALIRPNNQLSRFRAPAGAGTAQ